MKGRTRNKMKKNFFTADSTTLWNGSLIPTLVFAEISKYSIPSSLASCFPSSAETTRWSVKSILLQTMTLATFFGAFVSTSLAQNLTRSKESLSAHE